MHRHIFIFDPPKAVLSVVHMTEDIILISWAKIKPQIRSRTHTMSQSMIVQVPRSTDSYHLENIPALAQPALRSAHQRHPHDPRDSLVERVVASALKRKPAEGQ